MVLILYSHPNVPNRYSRKQKRWTIFRKRLPLNENKIQFSFAFIVPSLWADSYTSRMQNLQPILPP